MKDNGAAKETHVEKPAQSQLRPPEPAMDRPARAREILRLPTSPHLHDGDAVALLRQPVGSHAAAKTGANYDEVEIKSIPLSADAGCTCGVGFALLIP
jgi:hypothetical protein